MKKYLLILISAVAMFMAGAVNAALVVDTGVPSNTGFPLVVDSNDFLAGQVSFSQNSIINSVQTYLTGGNTGDTFTIALYGSNGNNLGSLINSATAAFGADGWNGVSALNWSVNAGNYWLGIEEDALGVQFTAPIGVSNPVIHTAFNSGSGYQTFDGLQFGLQVDAVAAVPEPETDAMLLLGLSLMTLVVKRRKV